MPIGARSLVSVVDVPSDAPSVPPLKILIKPSSLLDPNAGRKASLMEYVVLTDRDHGLFKGGGHDAPLIEVLCDRDVLSNTLALRFRLTNEGHEAMLLPARYRPGEPDSSKLPTIELLIRSYRAPKFQALLHAPADSVNDATMADWMARDAVQFGAWPEGTKVGYGRNAESGDLDCTLYSPEGTSRTTTIRVRGETLNIKVPPFPNAVVNLDERILLSGG